MIGSLRSNYKEHNDTEEEEEEEEEEENKCYNYSTCVLII
jgi:hypothetical protein